MHNHAKVAYMWFLKSRVQLQPHVPSTRVVQWLERKIKHSNVYAVARSIPPGLAGRRLLEMTLLLTGAAAILALALSIVRDASRHRRACVASFQTIHYDAKKVTYEGRI